MNPKQPDPDEQKRLFLAILLCGGILFAWQGLVVQPAPGPTATDGGVAAQSDARTPADAGAVAPKAVERAAQPTPGAPVPTPVFEPRTVHTLVADGVMHVELDDAGQIAAWTLLEPQYRVKAEGQEDAPYRFVDALSPKGDRGQFLPPVLDLQLAGAPAHGQYTADGAALRWKSPAGVEVVRRFEVVEGYTVTEKVTLTNQTGAPIPYDLTVLLRGAQHADEGSVSLFNQPIYLFEGVCEHSKDFEREPLSDVASLREKKEDLPVWSDGVRWAGVDNRYFMVAALPAEGEAERCELFDGATAARVDPKKVGAKIELLAARLDLKGGTLEPGKSVTRTLSFYAGPKRLSVLGAASPSLKEAIDFGWFSPICLPMLWLMRLFFSLVGNWGLAIILLTVLVKIITLPLTHKQYKSMAAMKLLQPQLKVIQEKHKDDKMKLQQEMMGLYKKHNVSPLAGCLPAVMMMPIYFALYRTIYSAVELFQAPLGLWISDLSARDPLFVTPVLLGGLMVIQTRLNPTTGADPMQQKIMMTMMPIMFTAFMLFLPSGLVVYIAVNTVLGIAQQMVLLKKGEQAAPAPVKA